MVLVSQVPVSSTKFVSQILKMALHIDQEMPISSTKFVHPRGVKLRGI